MKLALPPGKDCKYVRRKLKLFWKANCDNKFSPENEIKEFNRALQRLFKFFQLSIPEVSWYEKLGVLGQKTLGECTQDGEIRLLTPYYHGDGFEGWLNTLYHEVGHYVLWCNAEKKASEFASKMRRR